MVTLRKTPAPLHKMDGDALKLAFESSDLLSIGGMPELRNAYAQYAMIFRREMNRRKG